MKMVQRRIADAVLLIEQDRVAVAEGAAVHVFANLAGVNFHVIGTPALSSSRITLDCVPTEIPADSGKRQNGKSKKRKKEGTQRKAQPSGVNFLTVLSEYPNSELALRLFTTVENGRIDHLLRTAYRGIRRDLDFVRHRLRERRPDIADIPSHLIPFEMLFQVAICGGATEQMRHAYPTVVRDLELVFEHYVFSADATVADSLMATRRIYEFFVEQPT